MSNNIFQNARQAVKHWYLPLIVGLLFVGVGIYTFIQPADSYLALAIVFSVSFLVAGFMQIVFSISNHKTLKNWGWILAFGILNLLIGILLVTTPEVSLVTLPFYVGFLLMFNSISAIGYAYDLKDAGVLDWGNLLAIGIFGLIFSFIMLWSPNFAGLTIVIWTGLAFLFAGIFSIYLSFKLAKIHRLEKKIAGS